MHCAMMRILTCACVYVHKFNIREGQRVNFVNSFFLHSFHLAVISQGFVHPASSSFISNTSQNTFCPDFFLLPQLLCLWPHTGKKEVIHIIIKVRTTNLTLPSSFSQQTHLMNVHRNSSWLKFRNSAAGAS